MVPRITKIYHQASPSTRRAGRRWYPRVLNWLQAMSNQGVIPVENLTAAFAALSPRIKWRRNCIALVDLLAGREVRDGFRANTYKAKELLWSNDPIADLNSKGWAHKTTAFAKAILGDCQAVTLDTWILKALDLTANDIKRAKQYARVVQEFRIAAELVNETPRDLQAIVWLHTKED